MNRRGFLTSAAAVSVAPVVTMPAVAETPGPLLAAMEAQQKASAYLAEPNISDDEGERRSHLFAIADRALTEALEGGATCQSLVEKRLAARIAAEEMADDFPEAAAPLALAALAYFMRNDSEVAS